MTTINPIVMQGQGNQLVTNEPKAVLRKPMTKKLIL